MCFSVAATFMDYYEIIIFFVCVTYSGVYIGFSKSPKYRVWVHSEELSPKILKYIETSSSSALDLAKKLFNVIFKEDLENNPDDICYTPNRLEGRRLVDQELLKGIRCKFQLQKREKIIRC